MEKVYGFSPTPSHAISTFSIDKAVVSLHKLVTNIWVQVREKWMTWKRVHLKGWLQYIFHCKSAIPNPVMLFASWSKNICIVICMHIFNLPQSFRCYKIVYPCPVTKLLTWTTRYDIPHVCILLVSVEHHIQKVKLKIRWIQTPNERCYPFLHSSSIYFKNK